MQTVKIKAKINGKDRAFQNSEANGISTISFSAGSGRGFIPFKGVATVEFDVSYYNDDYILLPACAYNGNRFPSVKKSYPPMFSPEEAKIENLITDVPRLNPDGSGKITVTAADMSVPCVAIWDQGKKKAVLLFFEQQIDGRDLGVAYSKGKIEISYPKYREHGYGMCTVTKSPDKKIFLKPSRRFDFKYLLIECSCESIPQLLRIFFENRKSLGLDCSGPVRMSPKEMWDIQEEKINRENYSEKLKIYRNGVNESRYACWQPGWTGNLISAYPLMKLGNKQTYERAKNCVDFLFKTQYDKGLFESVVDDDGVGYGDGFEQEGTRYWHLLRKSADCLYFLYDIFKVMEEKGDTVPEKYIAGYQKLADAFCEIFEKNHQLGQFVDLRTNEIIVPGSASAGIAVGGLARAYLYLKDKKYLNTAIACADYLYDNFIAKGFTNGGPGEMLQCCDSESAFGTLEGMVALYEVTGDKKHLAYCEDTASLASTWVMAYNYHFARDCSFKRAGIKTVGTVFANLQNKHSAPGICTLSGAALKKLYHITNDKLYLELITDIARTIGQCMSTESHPIYCRATRRNAPQGYICERVNTSDWEGEKSVGEIFGKGSNWCEVSNMLTIADLSDLL